MATGSARPVGDRDARFIADQVIDQQIRRVRRQIRLTDLAANLLVLCAGSIGFLVLATLVDHWVVELGTTARLTALLLWGAGIGWYLVTRVMPLVWRPINAAYAAQAIERGEPGLKNSLLNYLLLKREDSGLAGAVYQAVRQRAAADVSRITVEETVDRSVLIRAGYVLVTVMVLLAAYKILSPKDPFQSVRRILSPWSDIPRPARVVIEAVDPGDAEFVLGEPVQVSTLIRGLRAGDPVRLVYSTLDHQITDQTVALSLDDSGLRYRGAIPGNGQPLRQDASYQIFAGDAVSQVFHLRARPAPVISVESVEYEFPAYTRKPREVVTRSGDIRAVEGTRVTVHARTNQPIKSAAIEFTTSGMAADGSAIIERLPLDPRDQAATRSWTLELRDDHRTPKYSAYQLSFISRDGIASQTPVTHRIETTPDLPPELDILAPIRESAPVPVTGEDVLEVRAIDPDFGLTSIRLKATCGEQSIIDQPLWENSTGTSGQVIEKFVFRPRDYRLSVGSRVTYWLEAADNRTTPTRFSPNITRTTARTWTVEKSDDEPVAGENASEKGPGEKGAGEKGSGEKGSGEKGSGEKGAGEKGAGEKGAGEKGAGEKGAGEKGAGEKGAGEKGAGEKGAGEKGAGEKGAGEKSAGEKGAGEKGAGEKGAGEKGAGEAESAESGSPDQNKPGARAGDGAHEGQPLHDGEVIEKALEHLRRKEKDEANRGATEGNGQGSRGQDPVDGTQEKGAGEKGAGEKGAGEKGAGEKGAGEKGAGEKGAGEKGAGEKGAGEKGAGEKGAGEKGAGEKGAGEKGAGEKGAGEKGAGEKGAGEKGAGEKGAGEKGAGEKGAGEKGAGEKGAGEKGAGEKGAGEKGAGEKGAGEKGAGEKGAGEKGAGEKGQNTTSDMNPQKVTSPKPGGPEGAPMGTPQSEPSPVEGDKNSSTKGEDSGDRRGAGKQGQGQGGKQAGKDQPGSNSPSETGAEGAPQPGGGNASDRPGRDQAAPSRTGQSDPSKERGAGSRSVPGGENSAGSGGGPSGKPSDTQAGGGGAGNRSAAEGGASPPPAVTDANLEYTRKATDMVLEYLKNQKDSPDPELLEELGWTPDELRQFVDRWQKMKQRAADEPAVKRDLDDSLRGLGLRPAADSKRQGGARSDQTRGFRESGNKTPPPNAYQELFRSFQKGAARTPAESGK